MALGDIFMGGLQGGLSGGAAGAAFGGYGAPIGAGIGLLGGMFQGYKKGKGQDARKKAVGDARMRLEEFARTQRMQRQADMKQAMAMFDPVQSEITRLYG